MKELSIEEKAKRFDEAIEELRGLLDGIHEEKCDIMEDDIVRIFPELKESEDEKIRNVLVDYFKRYKEQEECGIKTFYGIPTDNIIAWLEKKGEQKSQGKLEDDVRRRSTIQVLEYARSLDTYNQYGKADIDKNIAWLEKQGEHKPAYKEYTFKAIPRLLGMIPPTDRAKSYCQKLIDSLEQEGYSTDAKIVRGCLKQMNGEKVAMATMDEQKPAWSEDDELHIRELESLVKQVWTTAEHENDKDTIHKMSDLSFFLKTLKSQPKQEWSEEEQDIIEDAACIILDCINTADTEKEKKRLEELFDKIQDLKPQSTWKPSDEQMNNK